MATTEAVVYAGTGTVAPMARLPTLAVVGATGAVGTVMCELLSARTNVWGEIRLIASARSAGRTVLCRGEELTVRALTPEVFDGVDVAMFDVPDEVSGEVGADRGRPRRRGRRQLRRVPDGRPDVPLVVPEINPERIRHRPKGIIANANCTTLAMIVAIAPLHREYGLRELVLASYQAASGAGQAGVDTLHEPAHQGRRRPHALGSRPGNVRQARRRRPRPVPGPAGAQRGALGGLARATTAGRPRR